MQRASILVRGNPLSTKRRAMKRNIRWTRFFGASPRFWRTARRFNVNRTRDIILPERRWCAGKYRLNETDRFIVETIRWHCFPFFFPTSFYNSGQPFRVVLTVISMTKITLVVVLSIEWSWLKNFIDRVNCNRLGDSDLVRLDFFVAAIIIESVFTFHSMTRQAPFTLTTLFVSDNTDTIGCWAILLYATLRVIVIFLWRRGY